MGRKRIIRVPENQRALPFRRDTSGVLAYANRTERRLLMTIAACFMVASALYVYAVMSSVVRVAHITELNAKTAQLEADVAELETMYLSRTEKITVAYASRLGYVHKSSRSFIERSNTLTLNTP